MTHSTPSPLADNTPTVTLNYNEEPIGLPPSEGFGYLDVNIGDELGPANRYHILRKLGYGVYSNVWLARDTQSVLNPHSISLIPFNASFPSFPSSTSTHQFVALKILTTNATKGLRFGHMDEQAFLQRISQPAEYFEEGRDHCLILLDSFDITREDDSGTHHWHCLVTELLGKTLIHVRREYPNRIIPLPMLKTALRHILRALSYLHIECDIIHTGIHSHHVHPHSIFHARSFFI